MHRPEEMNDPTDAPYSNSAGRCRKAWSDPGCLTGKRGRLRCTGISGMRRSTITAMKLLPSTADCHRIANRAATGSRTLLLVLAGCAWLTVANPARAAEATALIYPHQPARQQITAPIQLQAGPHLLLDDYLIESSSNLVRRVHVPQREPAIRNPIIIGKEDGSFQPYLTVIRDASSGRFRVWYGAHTEDFNPGRSHIGYLESTDGVHWLRPHRVLADPGPIQFGVSVLDEGTSFPKPAERYKFAWWFEGGLRLATSPDGFVWKPLSPDVLIKHNHDITGIFWDAPRKQYVATVSFYINGPAWKGLRRVTKHSTSTDLLHWSEPWLVVTPDDKLDEGETQFYAMDGYLTRGDVTIGMVKVLRDELKADNPPEPRDAYGLGYTTLAWTRDGIHWVRDREKFFDRHPTKGEWDHAHAWIDDQVPVGDEVFLYYGGYKSGHKVNRFEERQIGLVKMKRDRYVAREAGASGGSLRTPLLKLSGDAITLNADATGGEVLVQVLDAAGKPVRGFTRKDCRRITGDSLSAAVQWKKPLRELQGRPVRLEFFLRNARLFAFDLHDGKSGR